MKSLIFFILLIPFFASSKNLSWSKKWAQGLNNKTLAEVCKKAPQKGQNLCTKIKKSTLQDKTKFKLTSEGNDTVQLTFKKISIKVRRTDDPQVYLVNRKSLYLEEVQSIKSLQQSIIKLLPQAEESAAIQSLWISPAYANEFPSQEIGTAITFLIMGQREQEICENAIKVVKACKSINKELLEDLKKFKKQDTEVFLALLNSKKTITKIENITLPASYFVSLFNPVDDSKLNALTKCECKQGLCQIQEKKSKDLNSDYQDCKKNVQSLKGLRKGADNVGEHVDNLIEDIKNLESKNALKAPAAFKEDSYKPRNTDQ